jgi:hypothetical protein
MAKAYAQRYSPRVDPTQHQAGHAGSPKLDPPTTGTSSGAWNTPAEATTPSMPGARGGSIRACISKSICKRHP